MNGKAKGCLSKFFLFFLVKAFGVYVTNKSNTWLLVEMEFALSYSTRRQIPSLRVPMFMKYVEILKIVIYMFMPVNL